MFLPAPFLMDPKGGMMRHGVGSASPHELRRAVVEGLKGIRNPQ